ncbi:L,D-transpeptidase [Candidatus Saccharibacteria bacterium]|nr:L,D-transpeptidase [Candidatus Saccharibacteria bacterium]
MKKFISLLLVFLLIVSGPLAIPCAVYAAEIGVAPATEAAPVVLGPPALIVVYRISNLCFVYDANSQLLNTFPVSTGRFGYETPLGVFQIYQHTTGSGYHPMVDGTYGRYCMRFLEGGYMFHSVCYAYPGAPEPIPEEVASIGASVSRGCIRLNVADAAWLYNTTPNGCLVAIFDY